MIKTPLMLSALLISFAERSPAPIDPRGLIAFGYFTLGVGLVSIIYPKFYWMIGLGRKTKEMEPPKGYLILLRFGGILACLIGLAMINAA